MQVKFRLKPGMVLAFFDEKGNAEILETDKELDENGDLAVTGHIRIANPAGSDAIYDEVNAYLKGDPSPANLARLCMIENHNVIPFPVREIRDVA